MGTVLNIRNIETYYGNVMAIKGISIRVDEGQIVSILGGNGAGKTTILRTISGVILDQPEKGTIEFMGRQIQKMDPERIVKMGISHVPEGREIFPELTTMENLRLGAYNRHDHEGGETGPSSGSIPISPSSRSGATKTLRPSRGANNRCWP
jgi:branched-chain amino acid transport system ATP-binding protein